MRRFNNSRSDRLDKLIARRSFRCVHRFGEFVRTRFNDYRHHRNIDFRLISRVVIWTKRIIGNFLAIRSVRLSDFGCFRYQSISRFNASRGKIDNARARARARHLSCKVKEKKKLLPKNVVSIISCDESHEAERSKLSRVSFRDDDDATRWSRSRRPTISHGFSPVRFVATVSAVHQASKAREITTITESDGQLYRGSPLT